MHEVLSLYLTLCPRRPARRRGGVPPRILGDPAPSPGTPPFGGTGEPSELSSSHAIPASQGIPGHVRKLLGAAAALLVIPTLLGGAAARNGAKFKGDCIATRTPSEAFSTKTIECPEESREQAS